MSTHTSVLSMSTLSLVVALWALSCSHTRPFTSATLPTMAVPPAETADIESTLFLIGDAGEPTAATTEPNLLSLTRQLSRAPDKSTVIFLGDNLYPAGLPVATSPLRAAMEGRLLQVLQVIKHSGAYGIIMPGNHDWDRSGPDGWQAVKRQAAFVQQTLGAQGAFLPKAGCPGPEIVDIGHHLRLILLDTQWWLHKEEKPQHPDSDCLVDAPEEITTRAQEALVTAGARAVLVAAHHPLDTHGIHGGFFGWRDHLFPLRNFSPYLWLPLPGVGSLYPLVRSLGVSSQDLAGPANRKMRQALEAMFKKQPPLAFASGHEHSLQVLTHGDIVKYLLVSGHGTRQQTEPVSHSTNTLFAYQHPGFMRLDILQDGRVRLGVMEPRGNGSTSMEVFSMWLRGPTGGNVR
jgi:hypothetical protein